MSELISRAVTPPGGWRFQEGEYWIKGQTFNELVENLRLHRMNNKKPDGHPVREVQEFIAAKYPSLKLK